MRRLICLGAVALAAMSPASALAGHPDGALGVPGVPEAELREFEERVLGSAHALEHARARREVSEQDAAEEASLAGDADETDAYGTTASAVGPPAEIGQWVDRFSIPVMAVHAAVLPTGKVLWFSYPENPNTGQGGRGVNAPNEAQAWLWDPATRQNKQVDPPLWRDPSDGRLKPANIWCAGQTFLADGRLLVVGGNLRYEDGLGLDFKGLNKVYTFNPWNETWKEQPDMRHGRWYPTAHRLADGRVVIMAGRDETGVKPGNTNKDVELFTPSADLDGAGTMSLLGSLGGSGQPPDVGLYPHMFLMPSGRSLIAGPHPNDSWLLNPPGTGNVFSWLDVPNPSHDRVWDTAVQVPAGPAGSSRVMQIGGSDSDLRPTGFGAPTTTVFDENAISSGWQPGGSMKIGRSHHNTVLLPDGSMVTVGGGLGVQNGNQWAYDPSQKQIELWDPATGTWRLGPAQVEARTYHSVAMLLPDGRVISAGDDSNDGGISSDTAEIYSPPYLFKGPRPTITTAPASVNVGRNFDVDTPNTDVTRAVLIAPSATTHAADMNQHMVPLTVAQRPGGVRLTGPPSINVAPPGYYMLFLVNSNGVPSVARWVRLGGPLPADPAPPRQSGPPPDKVRPVISDLSLTNKRFRVGSARTARSAAARRRTPVGTSFRFRLSETAEVVIKLQRARPGRKAGGRCRPPTRRLRSAKRCTRYVAEGSITRRNQSAGRKRISFSGRIGSKALPLGDHRAVIVATDAAGNSSRALYVKFEVLRGR